MHDPNLEFGGSSGSDGCGAESAATQLGADDTAPHQAESEEHETQVPSVKITPTVRHHIEIEAHIRHRVMFSTEVGADTEYQLVTSVINIDQV